MNLKQLEYVVEISKCGSINKAAQNLYVAQPSISASIKQLEEELGFDIFQRKNSGIELTSEGQMLLVSAKLIVDEVERVRKIPLLFDSKKNLSISGSWSSLLMRSFMQYRNDYPVDLIQDDFKETSFQQAVRDVIDQSCRISIVNCVDSHVEFHKRELKRYNIKMQPLAVNIPAVAMVSQDHALSRFQSVTREQLRTYQLVAYDVQNSDNWLNSMGLQNADSILSIFDRGGLIDAIHLNYVAVLPRDPGLEQQIPSATTLQIANGPASSIYLLSHYSYSLNFREKQFVQVLSGELQKSYPNSAVPQEKL